MAANMEISVIQKSYLFDLLMLKKADQKTGRVNDDLDILITKTMATMEKEDVAWVEKNIAQLP